MLKEISNLTERGVNCISKFPRINNIFGFSTRMVKSLLPCKRWDMCVCFESIHLLGEIFSLKDCNDGWHYSQADGCSPESNKSIYPSLIFAI